MLALLSSLTIFPLTFMCVPTNKGIVLDKQDATIKIQEIHIGSLHHLIFRPHSGLASCVNNVLCNFIDQFRYTHYIPLCLFSLIQSGIVL